MTYQNIQIYEMSLTDTSEKGQKTSEIGQTTFSRLMVSAECDYWSPSECVGFNSTQANFYCDFHGVPEDGFKVVVGDFGKFVKGEWSQMQPTDSQVLEMQTMIYTKVKQLEANIRNEELESHQQADDLMRHGHEGAIYGKWY